MKKGIIIIVIFVTVIILIFSCGKSKETSTVVPLNSTEMLINNTSEQADENSETETGSSVDYSKLSEKDYKANCKEMWYDDIFFGKTDISGTYVKLNLFIEESDMFKTIPDDSTINFIKKYNLNREFFKCGVKRKSEDSYAGVGQVNLYFSNNNSCDKSKYKESDHIIIYGQIVNYGLNTWNGYNICGIIPQYIEAK